MDIKIGNFGKQTMTKSGQSAPLQEEIHEETSVGMESDRHKASARSLPNATCSCQQNMSNGLDDASRLEKNGFGPHRNNQSSNSDPGSVANVNDRGPSSTPDLLPVSHERSNAGTTGESRITCICNCRAVPYASPLQNDRVPVNGRRLCDCDSSQTGPWYETGADLSTFGVPHPEANDDMESYFNANAHLLREAGQNESSQEFDNRSGSAGQRESINQDPNRTLTSEDDNAVDVPVENNIMQTSSDIDSSKSDSLHEEGFFEEIAYMQTRVEMAREGLQDDSFEDGDFIEPDIPRNAFNYASSSSNSRNSTTSSYEDLPTITTECDLHRNRMEGVLGIDSANSDFRYGLENCPGCGGLNVGATGSGCSRPVTLNTRPDSVTERDGRANEQGFVQQPKATSTSSSESSFKTTSSSFQSPQHSDGSVFCGCTPDSSSFPSHEDFLDSDLGSTWSRHTSHSSASNMPSAEVSYCASSDHHGCLCHNHADLLRLPPNSQTHTREPLVNGASTSAAGHPEDRNQCNLGLCASRVNGDRDCAFKANNCDSLEGAASGLVLSGAQSNSNQLDSFLGHNGACSVLESDPFGQDLPETGHWSDSNIVTGAHGAVDTRERSGLLNVSRQTSTSNFDQDENSFQEDVDDRDLCQVCQKQLDLSEDEDEGEKLTNHDTGADSDGGRSSSPGTESSSSSRIRRSQSAPGDVRRPGSLASLCMEFAQANRQHNTLPGRLRVYGSGKSSTCNHNSTIDSPEMSMPAFSIFIQTYILPQIQSNCIEIHPQSDTDQVDKVMIWSEYEAYVLQVTQIDASACGATAVINILKALKVSVTVDDICKVIVTNRRAETAPLPEYLLSRSIAGATAEYLIQGIEAVTGGAIYGRFFSLYPQRDIHLRRWLAYWLEKGAVPLATLNYQQGFPLGAEIPDAWHHQMIYGVGPRGIYVTNPQDIISEGLVQQQLCSDSVLLVRRQDIVSRWVHNGPADLSVLIQQNDPRWRTMNVLGQVVNVLREERTPHLPGIRPQLTSHVRIPAAYRAGITLYVQSSSPACQELRHCPELPFNVTRSSDPQAATARPPPPSVAASSDCQRVHDCHLDDSNNPRPCPSPPGE